jgi:aldose 1-epimerase
MTMPLSQTVTDAGDTRYTLRNAHDMRVTISDRGATLISWWAPDRYGRVADVLLGHPDAAAYTGNAQYFGATVGRWANRIAAGRFSLDGADYLLDRNDGANHLHGGDTGFHQALWTAQASDDGGLLFALESPDGDGGYPGNLQVEVLYRLGDDGALRIDYRAVCDAPTPVNLTSHGYFNLNGGSAGIGDHQLFIDADDYLSVDAGLIPVGVVAVAGSAFDFRQPAPIGPRLGWPEPQLALGGGFDHCYKLRPGAGAAGAGKVLRDVAQVYDPGSGRQLSMATTEAGLQFYSGNFLAGVAGRDGRPYAKHDGFCLEAEAWPNQINGPDAEAVVLRPGQVYRQTTIYKLDVKD